MVVRTAPAAGERRRVDGRGTAAHDENVQRNKNERKPPKRNAVAPYMEFTTSRSATVRLLARITRRRTGEYRVLLPGDAVVGMFWWAGEDWSRAAYRRYMARAARYKGRFHVRAALAPGERPLVAASRGRSAKTVFPRVKRTRSGAFDIAIPPDTVMALFHRDGWPEEFLVGDEPPRPDPRRRAR